MRVRVVYLVLSIAYASLIWNSIANGCFMPGQAGSPLYHLPGWRSEPSREFKIFRRNAQSEVPLVDGRGDEHEARPNGPGAP